MLSRRVSCCFFNALISHRAGFLGSPYGVGTGEVKRRASALTNIPWRSGHSRETLANLNARRQFEQKPQVSPTSITMSSLRLARSALRVRAPAVRLSVQRRTYADAVPDKIKLSLTLPHKVSFEPALDIIHRSFARRIMLSIYSLLTHCSH
jgi:hypothetical protein